VRTAIFFAPADLMRDVLGTITFEVLGQDSVFAYRPVEDEGEV
jgi:hypothetical protein